LSTGTASAGSACSNPIKTAGAMYFWLTQALAPPTPRRHRLYPLALALAGAFEDLANCRT
jgi:hypothetical protein